DPRTVRGRAQAETQALETAADLVAPDFANVESLLELDELRRRLALFVLARAAEHERDDRDAREQPGRRRAATNAHPPSPDAGFATASVFRASSYCSRYSSTRASLKRATIASSGSFVCAITYWSSSEARSGALTTSVPATSRPACDV